MSLFPCDFPTCVDFCDHEQSQCTQKFLFQDPSHCLTVTMATGHHPPWPLADTEPLSISMIFVILRLRDKWNHMICNLWNWLFFTQPNSFAIYLSAHNSFPIHLSAFLSWYYQTLSKKVLLSSSLHAMLFQYHYRWQPTPVFLPGEPHRQRNLAGYSPWGHKESDTTEQLGHTHRSFASF